MKEKLQEYALLAEIFGGIAIVFSLIFVGLQIQQNSEALLASSRQDLLEADLGLLNRLMDYPKIYDPANNDKLAGEDALRRNIYFVSTLRIREFAWQQYKNGILDEQTFKSYLEPLAIVFNSETGREFLLNGTYSGDPEFDKYVIEYMGLSDQIK